MRATTEAAALEAQKLLKTTWGKKFPVDPVAIADELGIDVIEAELDENVAGAIFKEPGQDPTIFLSASDSPSRKRFTAAHELGHYVMHAEEPGSFDYIDERSALTEPGANMEEDFADAFASELLMPKSEVKRLKKDGYTPTQLAAYFGVSQDAMYYRLQTL